MQQIPMFATAASKAAHRGGTPRPAGESEPNVEQLFRAMLDIRLFEETLLRMFRSQGLKGTTHTYVGQEAIAVAALRHLNEGDGVFTSHRCHGHYLAAGGDPRALFLEILGDRRGTCRGIGGSQHLHFGHFYSNGILGGIVPIATGLALARRIRGDGSLMVCFLGDGTLGEGVLYESLNMAALWRAPILFVLENNRYAQSTPIQLNLAGSMADRFRAFGIETAEIESNDVFELDPVFAAAFDFVRSSGAPFCQIVHTYRLEPHSKGDDFRDPEEIKAWRTRDPLVLAEQRIGAERAGSIRRMAQAHIDKICTVLDGSTGPSIDEIAPDSFPARQIAPARAWRASNEPETALKHLQRVLGELMAEHHDMHILGEDLIDPYGGAFKVTAGLSTRFPQRVWTTPISEAGIVGVANGLALAGLRPVVEIMFGDFITLAMDQLVNHASKFARMYGNQASCPIIVRTPMGGHRGYGPTHSQSLEKLLAGVPGLTLVALDAVHDQKLIWSRMLELGSPCVYIEDKVLYSKLLPKIEDNRLDRFAVSGGGGFFPTTRLSLGGPADAVILCYGAMLSASMDAALRVFIEDERLVDIVVASCIAPAPVDDLVHAIGDTSIILVAEEGTRRNGIGAEWIVALNEAAGIGRRTVRRLATPDTIIPNDSRLEASLLPDAQKIVTTLRGLWNE
jgi:2-oxoisovalerate dehydrogenase E1 component